MSDPSPLIPVTLLTGFLGSGKTTVLNHVLKQPDMAATAVSKQAILPQLPAGYVAFERCEYRFGRF